jgi:tripartite-type tricarboxylate transporter receptor subunit TctC
LGAISPGAPSRAEPFYKDKTITLVVGGGAGISYDAYARAMAPHIAKYIEGSPRIIVQNMPGAGSMKAAEYMYTLASKDGTSFAILFPGALIEPLMSPGRFKFDPNKFEYLGTLDQDTRVCMTVATSKVQKLEDAKTHSVIMAGTQPGSSTVDYPNMLNALAGTKFKLVSGYKTIGDAGLAVERGEADGMCGNLAWFIQARPEWLDRMLVQIGRETHAEMDKRKVPTIWGFVSPETKPVIDLIVTQQVFGRPFVLPPGVPKEQLETMRKAFSAVLKDKGFNAEIEKMKLTLDPLDGAKVSALIKEMFAAPKDVVERMTKALKSSGS